MTAPEPERDRPQPVYVSLAARVRDLAIGDGLGAGDRLPPERDLARRLGVSRTSLREALTALRMDGMVEVQHGIGIHLLRAPADHVPPIAAELRRLHPELPAVGEVRNALESLACALAAHRRSEDDLAHLVTGIRFMESEIGRGLAGVEGDRMFHAAVLRAARNPVLSDLLGSIAEGSSRIAAASLGREGQPARSLATHRSILEAVIMRDGEQARRLMHEHLELTGEIAS